MTGYWVVGHNMPGYMPMDDGPAYIFDDFEDAKRALIDDMEHDADAADSVDGPSQLGNKLAAAMEDVNLWSSEDSIIVTDPDREHDLGTNYWVAEVSEDDAIEAMVNEDGGMCPSSRYGRHSSDMVEWVRAMVRIFDDANAREGSLRDMVDGFTSQLVDDSDGPAELIAVHGTDQDHANLLAYVVTNVYAYLIDQDRRERPDSQGYAIAALMDDGGVLCERCAFDETNPVHPAGRPAWNEDGWGIVDWAAWEHQGDTDELCDHCGRVIGSDDDDQEEN